MESFFVFCPEKNTTFMDFFEIEMKKSSGVYTQSIKWKSKR